MRHFSRFLRSGSPNCWHCETPVHSAGDHIFILRTLIWGTRGVKGKAHCAISVVPTLAQRTRKNGAPAPLVVQAGKASATRWELSSTHGTELGWTGEGARLSTCNKKPRSCERGAIGILPARTPALRD